MNKKTKKANDIIRLKKQLLWSLGASVIIVALFAVWLTYIDISETIATIVNMVAGALISIAFTITFKALCKLVSALLILKNMAIHMTESLFYRAYLKAISV